MKIAINLSNVEESKPVPAGLYDLTILDTPEEAKAGEKAKNPGAPQLVVNIGINGHEKAPNVRHYISLPANGDEPRASEFKGLLLKRFLSMFSIPYDGDEIDLDSFAGASARGELTLDDTGDFNRLVVPRMRGEGTTTRGVAHPPKR